MGKRETFDSLLVWDTEENVDVPIFNHDTGKMEIKEGHSKKWIDMNDRLVITDPHARNDINYLRKLSLMENSRYDKSAYFGGINNDLEP